MFQRIFARFLTLSLAAALAACSGGDDEDSNAVPAGARVCELKQVPASSLSLPVDIYDDDRMASPQVRPAGDDIFTVDYPFAPGAVPQPLSAATLTFQTLQFGYHITATTLLWGCAVQGLTPGDKVVIRGGPRNEGQPFFVSVRSEMTLAGKKISSEWVGFWIDY